MNPSQKAYSIPKYPNMVLGFLFFFLNLFQWLLLPLLLRQNLFWVLGAVPLMALHNTLWSLIHECIHGNFHPSPFVNLVWGRILSVVFGSPFILVRASHLLHHQHNREKEEVLEGYDPQKISSDKANKRYFVTIFAGTYLFEFFGHIKFLLPRKKVERLIEKLYSSTSFVGKINLKLLEEKNLIQLRQDSLGVLLLLGTSLYLYRSHLWVFFLIILSRTFFISFLDNVYHYNTALGDRKSAQNLWLPEWVSAGLLYFNYHHIHHQRPQLPWIHLPQVFRAQKAHFSKDYFSSALEQLNGVISYEDLGKSKGFNS